MDRTRMIATRPIIIAILLFLRVGNGVLHLNLNRFSRVRLVCQLKTLPRHGSPGSNEMIVALTLSIAIEGEYSIPGRSSGPMSDMNASSLCFLEVERIRMP